MQGSNTGVGRRVLAAVAGWLRRLRGANVESAATASLPMFKPIPAEVPPAAGGRPESRVGQPQPPPSSKRSGRPKKTSRRDHTNLTLDQLGLYLQEDGFSYSLREDGEAIEASFGGRTGVFRLMLFLRDEPALLGVVVRIPEIVPEPKRPAMAETLTRANYSLSLGCFELDMADGEISFRISIPLAGAGLTREQLRSLLGAAMWTTDRYHRAFCRLLYADDLSPAEVIAEVEMA